MNTACFQGLAPGVTSQVWGCGKHGSPFRDWIKLQVSKGRATRPGAHRAHGVAVSHPFHMRKALGSIPSGSMCGMGLHRAAAGPQDFSAHRAHGVMDEEAWVDCSHRTGSSLSPRQCVRVVEELDPKSNELCRSGLNPLRVTPNRKFAVTKTLCPSG